jgi:hypothetical protein
MLEVVASCLLIDFPHIFQQLRGIKGPTGTPINDSQSL